MEITLKAEPRNQTGKGAARRLRSAGVVPAVLYGPAIDPLPLEVDVREITNALHTEAGYNVLINLKLDSKTNFLTMLREVQRDPVRGNLLHIDFLNVSRDVKIHANVPVHIVGESHGVKEGGVLEHHLWEISVEALPGEVPPSFDVDVAHLGIGQLLRAGEIAALPGVTVLTDPEEIVAAVVEPQILQVTEEVAVEEAEAVAGAPPEEGEGAVAPPEETASE